MHHGQNIHLSVVTGVSFLIRWISPSDPINSDLGTWQWGKKMLNAEIT